jgi:multidrug efflux system membrane fusion protein
MKKALWSLLFVFLVAGVVWRIHGVRASKAAESRKDRTAGPVPVLTAGAVRMSVPIELRTFGTVEASATVTLRAQVTGLLAEVYFVEGQEVQSGDRLFRIDSRPFDAALHQAEATLARTQAQRINAEREARRSAELFAKGFVSETDRDQAQTTFAALQATERADAAAVENARIQLGYCEIRAPMAGRTGRLLADAGNLVAANATTLTTLARIQPVHVSFAIPQQERVRLRGWRPDLSMAVEAAAPEDPAHTETGTLRFLDNAIDRATGTWGLKAAFSNDARRLWPGQFVTVRLTVGVETNAVVIPFRAVQNGQKGTYVFVVRPDRTVEARLVKISRTVDERSLVSEGLEAGETVVTDGQQRLGPGSPVQIQESHAR